MASLPLAEVLLISALLLDGHSLPGPLLRRCLCLAIDLFFFFAFFVCLCFFGWSCLNPCLWSVILDSSFCSRSFSDLSLAPLWLVLDLALTDNMAARSVEIDLRHFTSHQAGMQCIVMLCHVWCPTWSLFSSHLSYPKRFQVWDWILKRGEGEGVILKVCLWRLRTR